MESFPLGEDAPFVRTDFSDDSTWNAVCAEVRKPNSELQEAFDIMMAANAHLEHVAEDVSGVVAHVDIVSDRRFENFSLDQLLQLVPEDYPHTFLFVFDRLAASHADHPILIVDLYHERGRVFRAVPSQVQGIKNNLSIANMDWEDFAENLDEEGVFRGFT